MVGLGCYTLEPTPRGRRAGGEKQPGSGGAGSGVSRDRSRGGASRVGRRLERTGALRGWVAKARRGAGLDCSDQERVMEILEMRAGSELGRGRGEGVGKWSRADCAGGGLRRERPRLNPTGMRNAKPFRRRAGAQRRLQRPQACTNPTEPASTSWPTTAAPASAPPIQPGCDALVPTSPARPDQTQTQHTVHRVPSHSTAYSRAYPHDPPPAHHSSTPTRRLLNRARLTSAEEAPAPALLGIDPSRAAERCLKDIRVRNGPPAKRGRTPVWDDAARAGEACCLAWGNCLLKGGEGVRLSCPSGERTGRWRLGGLNAGGGAERGDRSEERPDYGNEQAVRVV